MFGCFCSTSAHRRVSAVTHSFPTATSIHRYRAIMRLRCDHRRVYNIYNAHKSPAHTSTCRGGILFYTHRTMMPQRQDRLQMFQSMRYHATHARTHTRRCVETRAFLACGTGSCIFYSRLTCASQRPMASVANLFFFFIIIISPAGIFSQLRDHVIRASRAKFPLTATFTDFVFLGDVRFF